MLIPASSRYSNNALIELTGDSAILEARLKPITAELNAHPLRVNRETWLKNLECAEENANFLIDYCRHLAGDPAFRPNSPADVKRALNTDKTDKDSLLGHVAIGSALADAIIDARSAISRWSQLKKWHAYAELGAVQPHWDSLGTPHGRYTSEAPCLNNRIVPIRETIEANPGYSFLSLDLSQAEYCTWASLSRDPVLSQAFREGRDFHTAMARMVKDLVPEWSPSGDLRQAGKTLNFSILYLMKAPTLARKLGCAVETAMKIISAYYSQAASGARYIQEVLSQARQQGYVETYYGRRRYCPELQEVSPARDVHEIEKTCWSHVNAGTAAEVTKQKQIRVWQDLRRAGFDATQARLSLQMYDGLLFSVRDDVLPEVQGITEEAWNQQEEGFLPFRSQIRTGKTWGEISR